MLQDGFDELICENGFQCARFEWKSNALSLGYKRIIYFCLSLWDCDVECRKSILDLLIFFAWDPYSSFLSYNNIESQSNQI